MVGVLATGGLGGSVCRFTQKGIGMGKFTGVDGVGILWFTREDYPACLAIMADRETFPRTYDEWHKRTQEAVAFVEREGGKVIRVETSAQKLGAYCMVRGMKVDSYGRQMFASDVANWPASSKH